MGFYYPKDKMVRISVLADALKNLSNAEKRNKRQVLIRPASKVTVKFLSVMQKHGYIDEFTIVDDHRAGKIVVQLNDVLTNVVSSLLDLMFKSKKWKNGPPIYFHLDNLDSSSLQLQLVLWIMRRLDASMLEEKFLDFSFR